MDIHPIALTGATASGKSTVLAMLAGMGFRTASGDEVAREVFQETFIQEALAAHLCVSGAVDPSDLRAAIAREPDLRRWLNRLMHPHVGRRMAALDVDFVEVPLLFEACLQWRYREVWVIACGDEERARRLRGRYGPDTDPKLYEKWQLSESVKVALGDVEIRTDCPRSTVLTVLATEVARSFSLRIAHRS